MKWFIKFFKKAEEVVDNNELLVEALFRSDAAQSFFNNIDDELTQANGLLLKVIQDRQEELAKLQKILAEAEEKLKQNNMLKSRLSEFVSK